MLTSDLVRVRRVADALIPRYLRGPARLRLLPVAKELIERVATSVGKARRDVDAGLAEVATPVRDRAVVLGLRKLLEDRCDYDVEAPLPPETVRFEVFDAAAKSWRDLDVRGELDREAVLRDVAGKLGTAEEVIERSLYADLRENEVLRRFHPIAAPALLDRYDVALAQGVLLRAEQVTVKIEREPPERYRAIFRAARFHGLLHVVQGDPDGGYTLTLDGPFSLFGGGTRYGLKLALFLPSVLPCAHFHLHADVIWSRSIEKSAGGALPRERLSFDLRPEDGLVATSHELPTSAPDVDAFCAAFERLGSEWEVARNERVFALPGEVVCVPDLVFRSSATGEEVFLEAFGFWSRQAVFRRIELVRSGFPARIVLAVSKRLRVSEELLGEHDAGELYVYGATMSARTVLERLRTDAPRQKAQKS